MIESRFSLSLAAAFVFAGLAFSSITNAEEALKGSAEAGATKAAVCTACHGVNGNSSNPEWPNLAGQHETYLQVALERYKTGQRVDMVMNPLIAQLDKQSIEELAAFFASQPHLHNTEP